MWCVFLSLCPTVLMQQDEKPPPDLAAQQASVRKEVKEAFCFDCPIMLNKIHTHVHTCVNLQRFYELSPFFAQANDLEAAEKSIKKKEKAVAKAAAVPKPRGRPPKKVSKVTDDDGNENGPSAASGSQPVGSKRSRAKPNAEAKEEARVEASAKKKPARASKKRNQEEGSPKAKGGKAADVEASAKAAANKKRKADADEHPSGVPKKRESKHSSADAKEKRRIRAEQALHRLKGEASSLPGLLVPDQEELGTRISFTQCDRNSHGTSVGVVLYSESFYVNKPAEPESWPSSCKWLKAPLACICEFLVLSQCSLCACHFFWVEGVGSISLCSRWMQKGVLPSHGQRRFLMLGSMRVKWLHGRTGPLHCCIACFYLLATTLT